MTMCLKQLLLLLDILRNLLRRILHIELDTNFNNLVINCKNNPIIKFYMLQSGQSESHATFFRLVKEIYAILRRAQ